MYSAGMELKIKINRLFKKCLFVQEVKRVSFKSFLIADLVSHISIISTVKAS